MDWRDPKNKKFEHGHSVYDRINFNPNQNLSIPFYIRVELTSYIKIYLSANKIWI